MNTNGNIRPHYPGRVQTTATMLLKVMLMAAMVVNTSSMLFNNRQLQNTASDCLSRLPTSSLLDLTVGMSNNSTIFSHLLPNILVERVPGTPGNVAVREFIKQEMNSLGWHVEEDTFTDVTPYGNVIFSNVIATFNPSATRRVVVACHHDSKYMPGHIPFLGAIDSAVPCSIMIDSARQLNQFLQQNAALQDLTLQFIFFDGEEAFVHWTSRDSLYGSRHLASLWENSTDRNDPTAANNLENIAFFVLLDLIGTWDTRFTNNYPATSHLYTRLVEIESCLRRRNLLSRSNPRIIFSSDFTSAQAQDDHIPFIQRGVPVVHLISDPFPRVWHTLYDNLYNLDSGLINDFSRIFRIFLASLHVDL